MKKALFLILSVIVSVHQVQALNIKRYDVVRRNNPHVTVMDSLSSLSVGNGGFAMTVDGTGLQSFPQAYSKGVPLGTMSDWGWHSFANPEHFQPEESWRYDDFGRGRKEPYAVQIKNDKRKRAAGDWYRVNPHRLHLGTLGLSLGSDSRQIKNVDQVLDMWNGIIKSQFSYQGKHYQVQTVCHPEADRVATHITSEGKIAVDVRFAYPTGAHSDDACDWNKNALHSTVLVSKTAHSALLKRTVDATEYYVVLNWQGKAKMKQIAKNHFLILAASHDLSVTCEYTEHPIQNFGQSSLSSEQSSLSAKQSSLSAKQSSSSVNIFDAVASAAQAYWNAYWQQGAMVDFSACKDPRAKELERRVVLSQYLLAIQDASDTPPQETGLTYNSWFGKFHLEMILWHQAQFALWGHPELLDRSLSWYFKAEENARKIAQRQGFKGVRWMKMTDPDAGEAPSSTGSFLIWQQPHLIYLAELLYRANPQPAILQKYARLVEETAEFMGDFAEYDAPNDRYVLRGCIAAQETLPAATTINPPFELSYWHCALKIAQQWRERLGKQRDAHWDDIIRKISPLASKDSLYLAAETQPDSYTNERMFSDHPAVMGAIGLFPYNPRQIDFSMMKKTEQWIWKNWKWQTSWGWDYPMMAMGAARMGEPENAVDALLMPQQKNTYLISGHNYQDARLRLYLPGNGGLLMAVAMMCAGWDGSIHPNPGFPQDGNWYVKWEGLKPLP